MKSENLNIYNEDGRKYTLLEYFNAVNNNGLFEIRSIEKGNLITGTYSQIKAGLINFHFTRCVQKIDINDYGTIIYLK